MIVLAAARDDCQASAALGADQHPREEVLRRGASREKAIRTATLVVFPKPFEPLLNSLPQFIGNDSQLWCVVLAPFAFWSLPRHAPIRAGNLHKFASIPYHAT